jgi:hypothetical protein
MQPAALHPGIPGFHGMPGVEVIPMGFNQLYMLKTGLRNVAQGLAAAKRGVKKDYWRGCTRLLGEFANKNTFE